MVPFVFLALVNTCIILELRRLSRRKIKVGRTFPRKVQYEKSITKVMITITLVFLVCHTPDRVNEIVMLLYPTLDHTCPSFMYHFYNVCNLLVIFNSSFNFVIYYLLRPRFRTILWRYIRRQGVHDDVHDYRRSSVPTTDNRQRVPM